MDLTSSGPPLVVRVATRLLGTKSGTAIHRRLFAPIDTVLMRLTGGRVNSSFGRFPIVVLHTTGARSGVQRDVPVLYFTDGNDVILTASNYGRAKHPSWYYNLLKHPECELFAGGHSGHFVARPTVGTDHDRLVALAESWASNFSVYLARTNGIREIPMLRLTPTNQ
ncbi:nitroreductase/quinone reductase family protein [Mycobacterium sp. Y57]|nr:nitroreductase/quinone reductase family protein [Mycolicibacterium xanthum]